jgi:hypothetical protein
LTLGHSNVSLCPKFIRSVTHFQITRSPETCMNTIWDYEYSFISPRRVKLLKPTLCAVRLCCKDWNANFVTVVRKTTFPIRMSQLWFSWNVE